MTTTSTKTAKAQKTAQKTGVHFDRITEVIDAHAPEGSGFVATPQKAFLQLLAPGGHKIYPAWGKPNCRRVDLTFVPPEELGLKSVIPVRAPNGAVVRELDTDHPAFLDDLATLLEWLKEAPPVVKTKRQAFTPSLPVIAQRAPLSKEEQRAKLEKIREVSRQHGVAVSASTLAALADGETDDDASSDDSLAPDLSDIPDSTWDSVGTSIE